MAPEEDQPDAFDVIPSLSDIETSSGKVLDAILRNTDRETTVHFITSVGISRQNLSKWRQRELKGDEIAASAEALGVPVAVFFDHHLDVIRRMVSPGEDLFTISGRC